MLIVIIHSIFKTFLLGCRDTWKTKCTDALWLMLHLTAPLSHLCFSCVYGQILQLDPLNNLFSSYTDNWWLLLAMSFLRFISLFESRNQNYVNVSSLHGNLAGLRHKVGNQRQTTWECLSWWTIKIKIVPVCSMLKIFLGCF